MPRDQRLAESTSIDAVHEQIWEAIRERQAEYDGLVELTKQIPAIKNEIAALLQAADALTPLTSPAVDIAPE